MTSALSLGCITLGSQLSWSEDTNESYVVTLVVGTEVLCQLLARSKGLLPMALLEVGPPDPVQPLVGAAPDGTLSEILS